MTLDAARVFPDEATFARLHRQGRSLPLLADHADPGWDPLWLVEALPQKAQVFLFETPGGPDDLEQRTFLSWDPEWEMSLRHHTLERRIPGARITTASCGDPLAAVRAALASEGAGPVPYGDGFSGGLVGYVSYDFKNWLERLDDSVMDDLGTPDMRLALVRRVVSWDHRAHRMTLHVHHRCRSKRARGDWIDALERLHAFRDEVQRLGTSARPRPVAIAAPAARPAPGTRRSRRRLASRSNLDRRAYDNMLARAREHILAGDIYQANLSHRFESAYRGDGISLYRRLRSINPSPFASFMRFPEHQLVSCSPERLVRVRSGRVETRPIAGTRPRGSSSHEDDSLERELLASEKERAEHLMIVDMARNDIGRVCELGSVRVESFMSIERYSHVRHLVSNVVGALGDGHDALDVLAAVFPGASITGVPKVRCMQIIDELEQVRRGVYTGSAGYFGLNGDMDLNILIRTFFLQDGQAYFHVGGGIVADSSADDEYHETLAKAAALVEAVRGDAARHEDDPHAAPSRSKRAHVATSPHPSEA